MKDFRGLVRLFPLPSLALFPHAAAPLHVFEPRYVAMVEDALAADRLIAMALLLPGWEADYEGRPPIAPMICVGRILTHVRLPNGRFNLLLAGVQRAEIVRELPPAKLFREAEIEPREDVYPEEGAELRLRLREELRDLVLRRFPAAAREPFEQLLGRPLPLGALADVIAQTVPWPTEVKRQLLEELNVDRRTTLLVEQLRVWDSSPYADAPANWAYPPKFSDN